MFDDGDSNAGTLVRSDVDVDDVMFAAGSMDVELEADTLGE
jgi:hypothetical protein